MFGFGKAANINEIDAAKLQALLAADAAIVIDGKAASSLSSP